ncbi:hypothetical protein BJ742DRAFT_17450 [Cladochytrium replicatum]|nr:hypothetical protein BJ742DRAFT_17450 [Cladochytrium replicatum]
MKLQLSAPPHDLPAAFVQFFLGHTSSRHFIFRPSRGIDAAFSSLLIPAPVAWWLWSTLRVSCVAFSTCQLDSDSDTNADHLNSAADSSLHRVVTNPPADPLRATPPVQSLARLDARLSRLFVSLFIALAVFASASNFAPQKDPILAPDIPKVTVAVPSPGPFATDDPHLPAHNQDTLSSIFEAHSSSQGDPAILSPESHQEGSYRTPVDDLSTQPQTKKEHPEQPKKSQSLPEQNDQQSFGPIHFLWGLVSSAIIVAFARGAAYPPPRRHSHSRRDQEMDHFLSRCSICFDSRLDFCLQACRDQFCRPCFQRYVAEVVKGGWGLTVPQVYCPVCRDEIPNSEWTRHADHATVALFNQYNQPFRPLRRHCQKCGAEVRVADHPVTDPGDREKLVASIIEDVQTLTAQYAQKEQVILHVTEFKSMAAAFLERRRRGSTSSVASSASSSSSASSTAIVPAGSSPQPVSNMPANLATSKVTPSGSEQVTPLDLRSKLIDILREVGDPDVSVSNAAERASRKLIAVEERPAEWREMQFAHVKAFSKLGCPSCSFQMCFSCGEEFHACESCQDAMRSKIQSGDPNEATPEHVASMQWKLENSKQCPHCSVLIHRDDGCFKVDCVYCGYKFCWICLGQFENGGCGFYRCQLLPTVEEPADVEMEDVSVVPEGGDEGGVERNDRPEIGVPDISLIRSRLAASPPH